LRSNCYRDIRTADRSDQGGKAWPSRILAPEVGETIAAFALIIAVNIGEGIDMGFDFWNWLLIALGAAAILQSVYRLRT